MYESHGTFDDEKKFHAEIAKQCKNCIVEIGVMHGATSKILLDNSNCIIYGIDPIIPDSMNVNSIGDEGILYGFEESYHNYVFIKDFSYNVSKVWTREIDYLFIDASHYYEDVKRDYLEWIPFVKKNGYISFHDSALFRGGPTHWEGPTRVVNEIIETKELEYIDTIWSLTIFKK